jgi:hypothetical protein
MKWSHPEVYLFIVSMAKITKIEYDRTRVDWIFFAENKSRLITKFVDSSHMDILLLNLTLGIIFTINDLCLIFFHV